ncbi:MAG TPA: hypothetical protein VEW28_03925 [Candidatus Kapabacteria bacterium]|nr:hypothetical protein [Candidatus Kapabacteria bacterium]
MNCIHFMRKLFIAFILVFPASLFAQTAIDMATKLENVYKNASAVAVSFSTNESGKVSLVLSSTANAYKLTSPSDDFISDGSTIWHIIKKQHKVIIDNVKPSSQAMNAEALLNFSGNYTPSMSIDKNQYINLTLTPHSNIQQLFTAVGGISSITFLLMQKGSGVTVRSISALGGSGTIRLEHLQIKALKKAPTNSFSYSPAKDMTIVDLRE